MDISREGLINKGSKTLNAFLMEDYPKQSLVARYDLYKRLSTADFTENDEKELLEFIGEIKEGIHNHIIEVSILPIIEQKPCVVFTHLLEALSEMEVMDLKNKIM